MKLKYFVLMPVYLLVLVLTGCSNKQVAVNIGLFESNLKVHQEHITTLEVKQENLEKRIKVLELHQVKAGAIIEEEKEFSSLANVFTEEVGIYIVGTWEEDRECLSNIAEKRLYSAYRWREIFELNKDKIKNPHLIYPNQKLRLPK